MTDIKPTPEQKRAAREFAEQEKLCPYCEGAGYTVGTDVGYGGPDENGEPIPIPVPCQNQCQWCDEFGSALARLLAEREAAVRRVEWVPVGERLPEPGVPVLACFRNEYGKIRRVRAEYSDGKSLPCSDEWADGDWGVYSEEEDEYFAPEGWFESNEFEEIHWQIHGVVTHWMPLPTPPPGGPGDE